MKRTRLKRKTQLKRYTPMKRRSKKQQTLMDETSAMRHAAIEYGVECDGGCGRNAEEPHEITAGSARRHLAMREPRAQMFVCEKCHSDVQGKPYGEQIAIVTRAMIEAVNRCHGSRAVSVETVKLYL